MFPASNGMKQPIIISLGGSLVIPDEIDIKFLRAFKILIERETEKGKSFIIISGGGRVCRRYQDAAKAVSRPSNEDLDWIGIESTRINAELLRTIFGLKAHPSVIIEDGIVSGVKTQIAIGAGRVPGHSSDFDAILMAEESGAKVVINLSNIDYAYDKDPKKYPEAKKIEKISWADFRKIIPEKWEPGLNSPFDPVAAREAEKLGLEVAIMNGNNLLNLENYLGGKPFKGTVISL